MMGPTRNVRLGRAALPAVPCASLLRLAGNDRVRPAGLNEGGDGAMLRLVGLFSIALALCAAQPVRADPAEDAGYATVDFRKRYGGHE